MGEGKTLGRRRPFREKVPLSPNPTLLQKLSERKRTDRAQDPIGSFFRRNAFAFDGVLLCFAASVGGKVLIKLFQKFAQVEGAKPSSRSAEREINLGVLFSQLLLCHLARRRLASRSGKRVFAQSKSPRCFLFAPTSPKEKAGKDFLLFHGDCVGESFRPPLSSSAPHCL